MTYYPDLSPFRYGLEPYAWSADGPPGTQPELLYCWPDDGEDEGAFDLPEVNVGWLDPPHPFPRGEMAPELVEKLERLCRESRYHMTRGVHHCGFCRRPSPAGNGEIRIAGDGVVYAAPTLIAHYVAAHGYAPPEEFVRALAACDGLARPDPAHLRAVTPELVPRGPVPIPELQDALLDALRAELRTETFPAVSLREEGDDVLVSARIVGRSTPGTERSWRVPRAALLNLEQAVFGIDTMLNGALIQLLKKEDEP